MGITACANSEKGETAKGLSKNGGDRVPVVVDTVKRKAIPLTIDAIGAVESIRSVAIRSLVTGSLVRVNFKEGSEVKKDELLFQVDPRPFRIALASAEADLQKTRSQLMTAEEQVKRYSSLNTQGMVSTEQFQSIENAAQTLKAQILANEAAIENTRLQLEYCEIKAPCDGRTGSLGAHEGDLIRASDPNVVLVTITQMAPIYVTFAVPQQNLPDIQRHIPKGRIGVTAATSNNGPAESGDLTFLDNSVDATTGTIKLKGVFDNASHGLWPGQFVNVKVTLALVPNQLVVPASALQNGQRGSQAFVVREDKTVELRVVTVVRNVGSETIVSDGLKEGETVVVDGQVRLRTNTEIEIEPTVLDVPSIKGAPKAGKEGSNQSSAIVKSGHTDGGGRSEGSP